MENAEIALLVTGGIYKPASIERESGVPLSQWSVRQVQLPADIKPTHHFVGFNNNTYDGRVSSPVQAFDEKSRVGVTASGRGYKLLGEPGHNGDAEYVWNHWMSINGVKPEDVKDVTDQYKT